MYIIGQAWAGPAPARSMLSFVCTVYLHTVYLHKVCHTVNLARFGVLNVDSWWIGNKAEKLPEVQETKAQYNKQKRLVPTTI